MTIQTGAGMRIIDRSRKEREIIEAAIEVFSERGYEKSSVSLIAERAGIATGGIYNYFNNKEHLFRTVLYIHHLGVRQGYQADYSGGE